MTLLEYAIEWLAKKLKVPAEALLMFKSANSLSGLDRRTLPTELIPLNTMQLARGLFNFTVFQSLSDWVFPFWVRRQYDPLSPSFVPRSHFGLSINVTGRNWTAVGNPWCPVEPVVDPRGLVMPFRGGWAIDAWLLADGIPFFPSWSDESSQRLTDGLPIVETRFSPEGVLLRLSTFVHRGRLFHQARIENESPRDRQVHFAFAVRPFNPEGLALVNDLSYDASPNCFVINGRHRLFFSEHPQWVHCSSLAAGESAKTFSGGNDGPGRTAAHCPVGLANGFAAFDFRLAPGETAAFETSCDLGPERGPAVEGAPAAEAEKEWSQLLSRGIGIRTPDPAIDLLFRSSLATLLLLTDGDTITPGPFTYHQFWFRDAAYMIWALDKSGYASFTSPIIRSFPARQERSGYFRSQQGEWDSNGQALWTAWQHGVYSRDAALFAGLDDSLDRGIAWIDGKRLRGKDLRDEPFSGLMPAGLSAEHLGLSDYYFWDDFWSLAGIEAYVRMRSAPQHAARRAKALRLSREFRADIERAIRRVQSDRGLRAIPAGPTRPVDCGMIGSVAAWYPLQLFPPDDARMIATIETLADQFAVDGMFFQNFIHSGKNPYLTLQIAHAWLHAGFRERFWNLFSIVCAHASPTGNFPEAIHPLTGGGSMGDGHHGWAAAEVVLALRDAFISERWRDDGLQLDLLAGIPRDWFVGAAPFSVERGPIPGGTIDLRVSPHEGGAVIEIALTTLAEEVSGVWEVVLPFPVALVSGNAGPYPCTETRERGTAIRLRPGSDRLHISWGPPSSGLEREDNLHDLRPVPDSDRGTPGARPR